MSPLALRIGAGALALLALIALRGQRWAYLAFALLGLLYFPAQAHFQVHAPKCEQLLPTTQQLVPLLHNYVYIALFVGFYWMSWVQFERANARTVWALVATLLAAALLEIADGMSGRGQCRVRDLVPGAAGALGAALILAIWSRLTRKPAYVRIVKPGSANAPRRTPPAAPPPPPSAGLSLPHAVPPPLDFSPGPSPVTSAVGVAPTEVAARHVRRVQAMLGGIRRILQRVWASILGRRRAVGIGLVLLVLAGAGAFVTLGLRSPAPAVTAQPNASAPEASPVLPEPPPPPPLQSEAEGYYEPTYKFTVSDRRFTRLTLRPHPFITFSRIGTREQAACADARISPTGVRLRCELKSARMATLMVTTIDGQFTSRVATSRLDAPVLNALITITNTRGETLYRARGSFNWHPPD